MNLIFPLLAARNRPLLLFSFSHLLRPNYSDQKNDEIIRMTKQYFLSFPSTGNNDHGPAAFKAWLQGLVCVWSVSLLPTPQAPNSWDNVYSEELTNFEETGDEGEVWFGDESVKKMVGWSLQHVPPSLNPAVLEVGSGNGTLLFALAEAHYSQKLLAGIDYSSDAVKLATNISKARNMTEIIFGACDFLQEDPCSLPGLERNKAPSCWDLVLDKGTYDAIALGQKDANGRSPAAGYPDRLCRLLKPGGLFLITSCNFTEEELKSSFITEETGLQYHSRIQHPTFSFGGRTGSTVSSVAFKKPL